MHFVCLTFFISKQDKKTFPDKTMAFIGFFDIFVRNK